MRPALAKYCQFSKNLEIFGNIWNVYLIFGKVLNPLWDFLYAFGQNFIVVNGQILKKQSGHLVTLLMIVCGVGKTNHWEVPYTDSKKIKCKVDSLLIVQFKVCNRWRRYWSGYSVAAQLASMLASITRRRTFVVHSELRLNA